MGVNSALKARTAELGLSQSELVDCLNTAIEKLTGRYGTLSERTLYNMLSGRTHWPQEKQRLALEAVFGCTAEELGFQRPSATRRHTPKPEQQPVRRRAFLTSTAATAASAAIPSLVSGQTIGTTDVIRLREKLDDLVSVDDHRGGHNALETAALAGATYAIELQQQPASERIRQRLYSIAADFTVIAAFSCIDSFALGRAKLHLDQAATLAGLSQDSAMQLSVWNVIAMLAHHRMRPHEAVAAAHAAQHTAAARRDPFLASLAHARTAIGYSDQQDRQAALRSLGNAHDALSRASDVPRPNWTSFYGLAELKSLAAVVHINLGEHEQAEAASYQALGIVPLNFRRNRAHAAIYLAKAQLGQGDVEQACASAHQVLDLMAGDPLTGRMRKHLGDFHRSLLAKAPDAPVTYEWGDRARFEWSRQA